MLTVEGFEVDPFFVGWVWMMVADGEKNVARNDRQHCGRARPPKDIIYAPFGDFNLSRL